MSKGPGLTGIVGALLVMVGFVLVGTGLAVTAAATQSEISCQFARPSTSCLQTAHNAENSSVAAEYVLGAGSIVTGVGFFVVALSVVSMMARRDEQTPPPPPIGSAPVLGATGAPPSPPGPWIPPPPQ